MFREIDLMVIGAGPGGLAAAVKAKEAGAKEVVIVERAEELGGILPQCIHHGFGLTYFKEILTGPEYAHRFIKKVEEKKVEILVSAMVLNLLPDKVAIIATTKGLLKIKSKSIVLAMGCRERARGSILGFLHGDRGSGVLTAGTAQRLTNIEGYIPGERIMIVGSGDIGMIMARRYKLEGAEVVGVVELFPFIGGLIRNEIQCLRDFDIPVYLSSSIKSIHGRIRCEGVTMVKVDTKLNPVSGTEERIGCDTVILSVGLIPENELSIKAGVQLDVATGGPLIDECWQTNVPGIFAGGNGVHVHDMADDVSESCESAAKYAVEYVSGELESSEKKSIKRGSNLRYVLPHYFSKNRPLILYMRVSWPFHDAVIKVGNILEKTYPFIRPSQEVKLEIPVEDLKRFKDKELVVSCEGKEVYPR